MDQTTEQAFQQGADFLKMWSQLMTNMGSAGFSFSPGDTPPDAFKQLRASLLESMGKSFETYMRSPEFLDGMKQQMDGAVAFRKQMNQWMTDARHETQQPAREDIEQIDRRLRDVERDLEKRMDAVEDKLNTIVGLLTKQNDANGSTAKKASKKKTAKKTARRSA